MNFPNLEQKFRDVENEIKKVNPNCQIIVVTKEKPASILLPLFHAGVKHIGENKMQGLAEKRNFAKEHNLSFQFHLIAPIQTNKIKLLNFPFHYHCATELRHLEKLKSHNVELLSCLTQINISEDHNKSGILPKELENFLRNANKYYSINGLMTILENELSDEKIIEHYNSLSKLAKQFSLSITSMGMSHDYLLAAKNGASYVRIGSKIVGERG